MKATTARRITTIDPCQPWASCPFTTRDRGEAYDDLLDSVSMNDSGMVALIGQIFLDDGFGRLALQIPPSAFCT